jgi:hypothetical protein
LRVRSSRFRQQMVIEEQQDRGTRYVHGFPVCCGRMRGAEAPPIRSRS